LSKGTVVADLDVVVRILADPDWNKKARKVKTLEELRQMILDFCEVKGKIVETNEEKMCT
jgi:hypothetical protein